MNTKQLELYTDYLISNALGYATATGLSAMVDGAVSHDSVTRFLSEREYDSNEVMCWHYDHCKNQTVRGVNLLNALYYVGDVSVPVAFEVIRKPIEFSDIKTRKRKRASTVTKNELLRQMLARCVQNQLKFRYVLLDSWFASLDNFEFIVSKNKHFAAALKNNRLVALSEDDKKHGRYTKVSELELSENQAVRGWLKGFDHEVLS